MFQLTKIFGGLKNLVYWISGAALLSFLFKLLNTFLKNRAVRKSEDQGWKDSNLSKELIEASEREWLKQGEKTDKIKDES